MTGNRSYYVFALGELPENTNCCNFIELSSEGSLCEKREEICGIYHWIETTVTEHPIYHKESGSYYIAFQDDKWQVQLSPNE